MCISNKYKISAFQYLLRSVSVRAHFQKTLHLTSNALLSLCMFLTPPQLRTQQMYDVYGVHGDYTCQRASRTKIPTWLTPLFRFDRNLCVVHSFQIIAHAITHSLLSSTLSAEVMLKVRLSWNIPAVIRSSAYSSELQRRATVACRSTRICMYIQTYICTSTCT